MTAPVRHTPPAPRTMPDYTQAVSRAALPPDTATLPYIRKDPMVLYGIFVELARQIYSHDVAAFVPGTWVWDADRNKTQIWIDTEYKYNDENPDHNPSLFISLKPVSYSSYTGLTKGLLQVNLEEGEYEYQRAAKGQVDFIHIGNTKGEGVLLASNTFNYLDAFADVVRREFCFDKFYALGFQPLQIVKEEREKFRSVVSVAFEFQERITTKLESPKLKRLVFDAGQRVLDMLRSGS